MRPAIAFQMEQVECEQVLLREDIRDAWSEMSDFYDEEDNFVED